MESHNNVIFEALFPDVVLPERATAQAAGYDVRVYIRGREIQIRGQDGETLLLTSGEVLKLEPGTMAVLPLGFKAKLPWGIEAQVRLRSSAAFLKGISQPNAPATIDPDYPGEWLIILTNTTLAPIEIIHQERIAQIIFSRFEVLNFHPGTVVQSSDRIGGLGSTGK